MTAHAPSPAARRPLLLGLIGTGIQLSRTPADSSRAGPCLGEHSFEVLHDLLGYDVDHIADLAAAELLE